jgi:hypothetical protein
VSFAHPIPPGLGTKTVLLFHRNVKMFRRLFVRVSFELIEALVAHFRFLSRTPGPYDKVNACGVGNGPQPTSEPPQRGAGAKPTNTKSKSLDVLHDT